MRRRYIVKKGLQFRYIGLIFALVFLVTIVTGCTVFFTGWTLLGARLADVYPQGRLIYIFRTVDFVLIRNLLLISPFIFIAGLLFSHRIAGPLYRIERTIYEIAKGDLTQKIELRKKDELWELANRINTMTENLNAQITSNRAILLEMQKRIDGIKSEISMPDCDLKVVESSIKDLQIKMNTINSSFDKWTI